MSRRVWSARAANTRSKSGDAICTDTTIRLYQLSQPAVKSRFLTARGADSLWSKREYARRRVRCRCTKHRFRAMRQTGETVTSARVIVASTFAALAFAGDSDQSRHLGFTNVFTVLL